VDPLYRGGESQDLGWAPPNIRMGDRLGEGGSDLTAGTGWGRRGEVGFPAVFLVAKNAIFAYRV